jgi:glycosyltransferase involved in cell wall biosynthesis
MADRLEVGERVEFRGWVARERVQEVMRTEADVLLFPSLHDEAGWVVVEAMAAGLPVLCLDVGGPPVLIGQSGYAVPVQGGQAIVVRRIADALDAITSTARLAAKERSTVFRQDVVENRLRDLVRSEFPELEINVP